METQRVENVAYGKFCLRIVGGLARRCAAGDPEDLVLIRELRHKLDQAELEAIVGLRGQGWSMADVAAATGVSKQAVAQKLDRAARRGWLAPRASAAAD